MFAGLWPLLEALKSSLFPSLSCWLNSVPYNCRTEASVSLLGFNQGPFSVSEDCLHSLACDPFHYQSQQQCGGRGGGCHPIFMFQISLTSHSVSSYHLTLLPSSSFSKGSCDVWALPDIQGNLARLKSVILIISAKFLLLFTRGWRSWKPEFCLQVPAMYQSLSLAFGKSQWTKQTKCPAFMELTF